MLERLTQKTPKLVKKLQRLAFSIGSLGTIITSLTSVYDVLVVPNWIIYSIATATVINHLILQLFTENDV